MTTLASIATGNFTSASTWALCDTTSELDSIAGNTALTTSYVASSAFTPGVITIDGIAVRIASRAASPSGTISVELYNSTLSASVAGTEVTINISDITQADTAANGGCGWFFFKFSGPVVLIAATNYQVRAKTSVSTQVNLFRNATSNNWARQLRTTTTQAPVATNNLLVMGEWTAAATSTFFTVTMNETATTAYADVAVNQGCTLAYGTTAATNYYLKCQYFDVYGTFTIGTSGTPIPSDSTAILEFNSASNSQYGLVIHSAATFNSYGATRSNVRSLMTVDKAAAATSISVVDTTGWAASDEIVFPSTTRTYTECEKKTISSITNSTTFVSAALTNAHSGTFPTQAECGNLTRNVKIRGMSASNTCYITLYESSVADIQWTQIYWMGGNAVNKWNYTTRGIVCRNTSGSVSIQNSSLHDCTNSAAYGLNIISTSGVNIVFSNNIVYNIASSLIVVPATSATHTFASNLLVGLNGGGSSLIDSFDAGSNYTDNKAVGSSAAGITVSESFAALGTFSGNTAHSNAGDGLAIVAPFSGTVSSSTVWRNGSRGLFLSNNNVASTFDLTVNTVTSFGNATSGIGILGSGGSGQIVIKSATCNGGVTLVQPVGVRIEASNSLDSFYFEDCSFGATTAHTTADVTPGGTGTMNVIFSNCIMASTTELSSQASIYKSRWNVGVVSIKHDQVVGAAKAWSRLGTLSTDTTIFRTASPSLRLTPISASIKLLGSNKIIPVANGGTITVSVYVRKSAAGDGSTYNGNQPRLILRKSNDCGINIDTIIATATNAANGAWELLTGTSAVSANDGALEFYIDCDGTIGWVNVDDFTTTASADPSGMKYWFFGHPALDGPNTGGGSSGGSYPFC